jgi:tetratricopeptide (TPR) repeat protein
LDENQMSSVDPASPDGKRGCRDRRRLRAWRAGVLVVVLAAFAAPGCSSKSKTEEAIRRGDQFFALKQYVDAAASYREAAALDPSNSEVRKKLARAYLQAGDAIRAADLMPDDIEVQRSAIAMMLGGQRYTDALDRTTELLKRAPADPALYLLLGNAKSQLPHSWSTIWTIDQGLRAGKQFAYVLNRNRAARPADDREAEEAFRKAIQLDPNHIEARLALANFFWTAGRFEEGEEALQWVIGKGPDALGAELNAHLNRALGLYYLSQGRKAQGEKYLKIAAASGERDSSLALADFYIAEDRVDDAKSALGLIPPASDPDRRGMLRAAQIELRLNRIDAAMELAQTILTGNPNNAGALRIKGRALFAKGDLSGATTAARAALAADQNSADGRCLLALSLAAVGNSEEAFREASVAWRVDPGNKEAAKILANLALKLGRDQVALEFARQSVQLNPNDRAASLDFVRALVRTRDFSGADQILTPLVTDQASADVLVLRAAIHAGRGSVEEARKTYLRSLQLSPNSLDALGGLVALELQDGQLARAHQIVTDVVAKHPRDPDILTLAARVARAERDDGRAASLLRTALEIDPARADAAVALAEALSRQNLRDDAKRVIDRALALRPGSLDLRVSQARLLEETGRADEARTRYEAILEETPEAYAVGASLAKLYANKGDNLNGALSLAIAAKDHLPDDAAVSDTLGWVYVRKDQRRLAIPHLEDAVRAEPSNALFHYHLGAAYQHQNPGKARDELTRALTLDPNFPAAADAKTILGRLPPAR